MAETLGQTTANREAWLLTAAEKMIPWFKEAAVPVPEKFTVSIGLPRRNHASTMGVCFGSCHSKTKDINHVFISPTLDEDKPHDILETLLHEMIHVADDCKSGHGKVFGEYARKLGFKRPWTSTPATPELTARLDTLLSELGPFPHNQLVLLAANKGLRPLTGASPAAGPAGPKTDQRKVTLRSPDPEIADFLFEMKAKVVKEFGFPLDPKGNKMIPSTGRGRQLLHSMGVELPSAE